MVWYVWRVPGTAALLAALMYILLPARPGMIDPNGLIAGVLQVMALLPGFFIAALAAVATFAREEMDEPMPSPTPKVAIFREGKSFDVELTRRLFLTYLFSYLAIVSLGTSILCLAIRLVHPSAMLSLQQIPNEAWRDCVAVLGEFGVALCLFYVCASILVSTLHGIYFLAERMHQPH